MAANPAARPHTFEAEYRAYQAERRAFWDGVARSESRSWGGYYHAQLEHVYQHLIPEGASVLEVGCGTGRMLAALKPGVGVGVDFSEESIAIARREHPGLEFIVADAHELELPGRTFDYIILSDLANDLWDVQRALERIRALCAPHTRLILNFYSHLWSGPLRLAQNMGLATRVMLQNWLTRLDMKNLLELAGFQPLRDWEEILAPLNVPLVSNWVNRYLARIAPFRMFDLVNFMIASPVHGPVKQNPTVSVVVAARNESGHIDELMARIPEMGGGTEIVFVEGNSTDDTYAAIERAIAENPSRNAKLLKQTGKGKGDAVRKGFDAATGDILMILDADITVPPEDLPRFFDAIASGRSEFVNGVRLVYPMEEDAMRFANLVGNNSSPPPSAGCWVSPYATPSAARRSSGKKTTSASPTTAPTSATSTPSAISTSSSAPPG
jgi:SAM-dependent methyltransferase